MSESSLESGVLSKKHGYQVQHHQHGSDHHSLGTSALDNAGVLLVLCSLKKRCPPAEKLKAAAAQATQASTSSSAGTGDGFEEVDGLGRACRGAHENDNSGSHYQVVASGSGSLELCLSALKQDLLARTCWGPRLKVV